MRRGHLLNVSAFFVRRKDYKVDDRYFSKGALAWTRVMDVFNRTTAPKWSFFQDLNTALRHSDIAFNMMAKKIKGIMHREPPWRFAPKWKLHPTRTAGSCFQRPRIVWG